MRYRLLITDLDGTLLHHGGGVDPRDARAIAELQRKGVAVSIATGRMYSGSRDIARHVGIQGPIGCVDGSHVVDTRGDREVSHAALPTEAASVLSDLLEREPPVVFAFSRFDIRHDDAGVPYLPYLSIWSQQHARVPRVVCEELWDGLAEISGLLLVGEPARIQAAHAAASRALEGLVQTVAFPVSHPELLGIWGMIVRAAGVTKASALELLARHHGVAPEEVVAVGDWLNDVPMLRAAGLSFAMGRSHRDVVAAATHELRTTVGAGGGVAEAAERAGLL